ncbi:hypothetical protein F5Y16DRAFT_421034 [Xylariaceae sp. FL0255]|nr:hypothetical protein F5Y16DRAFT_421034 [Xylariaceae sp. FL0255]
MSISEMPQTFRDAVAVTHALGLRYPWIDSLCILQGDLEDWINEAAAMSYIYRYCHLLLGAARGLSDTEGFLQPREQTDEVVLGHEGKEALVAIRVIKNMSFWSR